MSDEFGDIRVVVVVPVTLEEQVTLVFFLMLAIYSSHFCINRFRICARLNGPDGQHAVLVLCLRAHPIKLYN